MSFFLALNLIRTGTLQPIRCDCESGAILPEAFAISGISSSINGQSSGAKDFFSRKLLVSGSATRCESQIFAVGVASSSMSANVLLGFQETTELSTPTLLLSGDSYGLSTHWIVLGVSSSINF